LSRINYEKILKRYYTFSKLLGGAMFIDNKTTYLKRDIMTNIAKVFFGDSINEINRLPVLIIPKDSQPMRCCIEKDRTLVKHRAIAIMGFDVDDEDKIDISLLSDYANAALKRDKIDKPFLTFLDEACKACVRVNYYVTDVCRNCVAKPCIMNCPKNAVSTNGQHAVIDKDLCINCGICQKVCPYHAIVYVPIPCEESCPVGAISKNSSGKEEIDYDKCIYCGKCIRGCPFGAVVEKSQIIDVIKLLKNKTSITVIIAPAISKQFNAGLKQIVTGLKKLGFSKVVEVAKGAEITAENEAIEFEEKIQSGAAMMGTSCCPSYVEAVNKHAASFKKYVSHTKTPMIYTANFVKEKDPENKVVFIGPCIAKKHEGLNSENVDFVLTFEELQSFFAAKDINLEQLDETEFDYGEAGEDGRGFSVSEGVSKAVINQMKKLKIQAVPVIINGLDKKNISLLKAYGNGKAPGNLIEVMACEGGCVCGPGAIAGNNGKQR